MMLIFAMESAEVTAIPQRLILTGIMILTIVWAIFGIRRAWKAKEFQQQEIPVPSSVPADFVATESFEGRFLGTSFANDWLKRVVVHGLGTPSRAVISVSEKGIAINLNQVREIFIPQSDIIEVRADRAIAGRAFEKDGIAVIVWKLGNIDIASGFRADTTQDHARFLELKGKKQESRSE
ncbi:MAG: hypothetical protein RL228_561 [Actinomycetota bacterium]